MIDHFGLSLLDEIHQRFMPDKQKLLDPSSEMIFRKSIKMAISELRDDATNWLCRKLSNEQLLREKSSEITHYTNLLDYIMKGLFNNPDKHITQWPNTALNESKTRKFEGRTKQPDFTGDVYKNCNDLIRLGVFMKDILDSSIDKGADIKVLGFQCIDYKVDYYTMDLVKGIYIMLHVGQMSIPASLKDMSSFVDAIELSLRIQDIFRESYENFYPKLCTPDPISLTEKATFKKSTLSTPKFRKLAKHIMLIGIVLSGLDVLHKDYCLIYI
ncbi:13926_t:CDS:2 [Gigaspora rosea]|nr:13926_t:CDS:2 [Gigaspora rosea]